MKNDKTNGRKEKEAVQRKELDCVKTTEDGMGKSDYGEKMYWAFHCFVGQPQKRGREMPLRALNNEQL